MAEVSKYLSVRGAIVTHAAYVADLVNFFGTKDPSKPRAVEKSPHLWLQPQVGRRLWPDDIRRHHAILVQEVFDNGLDLNLDFPGIRIEVDNLPPEEIPYVVRLLSGCQAFRGITNVTSPVSSSTNVQRWSVLHEQCLCSISASNVITRPHCKTRVTFVPQRSVIRLSPIVQYAVRKGTDPSAIHFEVPDIDRLWQSIQSDLNPSDRWADAATLRLLTFFGATVLGSQVVREAERALADEFKVKSVSFEQENPLLVLGPKLRTVVAAAWERFRDATPAPVVRCTMHSETSYESFNSKLRDRMLSYVTDHSEYRPRTCDTAVEALGKLFLVVQRVTDSDRARKDDPTSNRLQVGLGYDDLNRILMADFGVQFSLKEISLAVDYCVDRGLVVPKVVSETDWCLRKFYCGEDSENSAGEQLRGAILEAATELFDQRRGNGITPFDMHKICAMVKYLCPFFPVETGPYNFGTICIVGEKDLVEWLTPESNAPFNVSLLEVQQRGRSFSRKILSPNPGYVRGFGGTWSPEDEQQFFTAFKNIHYVFLKADADVKLLLSTCGTAERAFQAIAYELHAWAGSFKVSDPQSRNLGDMIFAARTDLASPWTGSFQDDVINALYWSLVYMTEARKKYRIWNHDYDKLTSRANKILMANPDVWRWWRAAGGPRLLNKEMDAHYDVAFVQLKALLEQIDLLTQFVVRAMVSTGTLPEQRLVDEWRSITWNSRSEPNSASISVPTAHMSLNNITTN